MCTSLSQVSCSNSSTVTSSSGSDSLLSPVGSISRPKSLTNSSLCSESTTSSVSSLMSNYPKAPGFEREDQVHSLLSLASGTVKHLDDFAYILSLLLILSHDFIYFSFIIYHVILIFEFLLNFHFLCISFKFISCIQCFWFLKLNSISSLDESSEYEEAINNPVVYM